MRWELIERRSLNPKARDVGASGPTSPRSRAAGGPTSSASCCVSLARLPFLFIAGGCTAPEALGRFAFAVLVVEFAARLATLGLKRGLAQQLAHATSRTPAWSGRAGGGAVGSTASPMGCSSLFPAMFPNGEIHKLELLLRHRCRRLACSTSCWRRWPTTTTSTPPSAPFDRRAVDDKPGGARPRLRAEGRRPGSSPIPARSWPRPRVANPLLHGYGLPRAGDRTPCIVAVGTANLPLADGRRGRWGTRRSTSRSSACSVLARAAVSIYYVAQHVASLPQSSRPASTRSSAR